jgi:hypothetical protein
MTPGGSHPNFVMKESTPQVQGATSVDKTYEAETRLFGLYRLIELNRRYYGSRAAHFERLHNSILVGGAIVSGVALGMVLLGDSLNMRMAAGVLACISAVVTTTLHYLKWDEKARQFYFLYDSFGQLFGEIEVVLFDVRRSHEISEQQLGAAKNLYDAFSRIEVFEKAVVDGPYDGKVANGRGPSRPEASRPGTSPTGTSRPGTSRPGLTRPGRTASGPDKP